MTELQDEQSVISISAKNGKISCIPQVILEGEELERFNRVCRDFDGKKEQYTCWKFPEGVLEDLISAFQAEHFHVNLDTSAGNLFMQRERAYQARLLVARQNIQRANEFLGRQGHKLWAYQETDIPFLASSNLMILALEPGTGKTGISLSAAPITSDGLLAGGIIVVAPADLLGMWQLEIEKWRPDLMVHVVSNTYNFRFPVAGELILLSYRRLPPLESEVVRAKKTSRLKGTKVPAFTRGDSITKICKQCPPNTVLILDEAHACRHRKSLQTQRARKLVQGVVSSGGKIWALTATPIEKPEDLASMLKLLGVFNRIFGSGGVGWDNFVDLSGGQKQIVYTKGGKREITIWHDVNNIPFPPKPELAQIIAPYILRRRREDIFDDLPPKIRQMIPIIPSAEDKKILVDIERRLKELGLTPEQYTAFLGGADRKELDLDRKVDFTSITSLRRDVSVAKFPHLEKLLDNLEYPGQPLLVVSCFRAPIEALADRKGPDGKPWGILTGDVKSSERDRIRASFQNKELAGIAMTLGTGGQGHTLTGGSRMVFLDLPLAARELLQAEDRLRPHLQKNSCHYYYLTYDHPIDRLVVDALLRKLETQENIIEEVGNLWAKGSPRKFHCSKGLGNRIYRGPATKEEEEFLKMFTERRLESSAVESLLQVWNKNGAWTDLQWKIVNQIVKGGCDQV